MRTVGRKAPQQEVPALLRPFLCESALGLLGQLSQDLHYPRALGSFCLLLIHHMHEEVSLLAGPASTVQHTQRRLPSMSAAVEGWVSRTAKLEMEKAQGRCYRKEAIYSWSPAEMGLPCTSFPLCDWGTEEEASLERGGRHLL